MHRSHNDDDEFTTNPTSHAFVVSTLNPIFHWFIVHVTDFCDPDVQAERARTHVRIHTVQS